MMSIRRSGFLLGIFLLTLFINAAFEPAAQGQTAPVCDPALGSANPANCIPPVNPGDSGDADAPLCDPALGTANPGNCIPPVDAGSGGDGGTDAPLCDPALGPANPVNCIPPVNPGDGGSGGDGGTDAPLCDPALGSANPGNCLPPVNPGTGGSGLPVCDADRLSNGIPCVPESPGGDPGTCDPGDGSYIPAIGDPGGVPPDGSDPNNVPLCFPPPDAGNLGNFGSGDIGMLAPGSFAGFTGDHINNLDPAAVAGISSQQLANLDPSVVGAFSPDQLANFSPNALAGLTPSQFQMLNQAALGGFTSENLAGLNPGLIQSMSAQQLQGLNPAAIQNMPGSGASRLLTNLDDPTIRPADVMGLLPEGWVIDPASGAMTAPPGAALAFRTLLDDGNMDGTTMPELPDFSSSLSLGGAPAFGADNVLNGLNGALSAADLGQYQFQQAPDGILNINEMGNTASSLAAFIPDTGNMVQAPAGFMPGLGQDSRGAYVLTTEDGYQIPLAPSPKDPDGIVTSLPGSEVRVGSLGNTIISGAAGAGSNPIAGIFDPMIGSSNQPPGLYRTGDGINEEALMVYQDGTAQRLLPMIQSPDEFIEAAGSIEGIDAIIFKTDGTIELQYQGENLILRPRFDVAPGSGDGSNAPSIQIEDGRYYFLNAVGDRQELLLASG